MVQATGRGRPEQTECWRSMPFTINCGSGSWRAVLADSSRQIASGSSSAGMGSRLMTLPGHGGLPTGDMGGGPMLLTDLFAWAKFPVPVTTQVASAPSGTQALLRAACPSQRPTLMLKKMLGASFVEALPTDRAGSAADAEVMRSVPIGCGTTASQLARDGTAAVKCHAFHYALCAGSAVATAAGAIVTVAASRKAGGTRMS